MPSDGLATKPERYIGLMSGTSLDGVDAVLADFSHHPPQLLAHHYQPFPDELKQRLSRLSADTLVNLEDMGQTEIELGQYYAHCCRELLRATQLSSAEIAAIGCHGQTVRHHPSGPFPFTLQLGEPSVLAELTGITTIARFRQRDMAAGGQGAPLVPPFHQYLFSHSRENRVVLNLGGMANITLLHGNSEQLSGFDTGPANVLIDSWCQQYAHCQYDRNGDLARQGNVIEPLLSSLLAHPYFKMPPPKSTGRELFHLSWVLDEVQRLQIPPQSLDVLTTLTELTARSVAEAIRAAISPVSTVITCGGGAYNGFLRERLAANLPGAQVQPSDDFGVPADQVEALAFAWLARQTMHGLPGNHPDVTGAKGPRILGAIYPA